MTRKTTTHWIWEGYSTERGMAFVTEMTGLSERQQLDLQHGRRLDPIPRVTIVDWTPGRFYDVLGAYLKFLIVAPNLRQALEESAKGALQFIPVKMRGKPDFRSFIVNVLETVPTVDLDRSKVQFFAGTQVISDVKRFVARPIPDDAPSIFHMAEMPLLIVVRDELRRALQGASDHPGTFTAIDKYRL